MLGEIGPSVALAVENALKLHEAEAAATTDYSTGLPNARSLIRRVTEELARAGRESTPVTVLVCETDARGGETNAAYASRGEALRKVSEILQAACRPYDYLARWSVSGFAIVLPGMDRESARERVAELIGTTNETARICYHHQSAIVAAGTASYPSDGDEANELLALAERRACIPAVPEGPPDQGCALLDRGAAAD
jgi:diguanylate cyclase (GGDEF)-like protein